MTKHADSLGTVGSGSYAPEDVSFLLRLVSMEITGVKEKERLIQSNKRHYSEMIGEEHAPTQTHMALYARALAQNGDRMAKDVQALALALNKLCTGPSIALVSFVRAGLPLGVLLRRVLTDFGREIKHYGISIIRDRGIDTVALEVVIEAHGAENIVFVDGWTGKGAISGEIRHSLAGDSRFPLDPRLVVIADPCGRAWLSASSDDWIIPSGVLGATVSGLVSRSIWPSNSGMHGCIVYENLREHDVTRDFVDDISTRIRALGVVTAATPWMSEQAATLQANAQGVVLTLAHRFSITNPNLIKPGIAEATRAVLRRVPEHVLVQSYDDQDVQLLMHLTERAGISVLEADEPLDPFRAVTIIKSVNL